MAGKQAEPVPDSNWGAKYMGIRRWKGKSLVKLRRRTDEMGQTEEALRVVTRTMSARIAEQKDVWLAELSAVIELPVGSFTPGYYSCPESPTLHCIYNDVDDPEHDQCIFCNEPSERK